jgi:ribosomal protein S4
MDLFLFLHDIGALLGRSEYRRLVCMGKINVNGVPIKFEECHNFKVEENDIVSIGQYEGKVWVV